MNRPFPILLGLLALAIPRPYGDEDGGSDDLKAALSPSLQTEPGLSEIHNANGADDTSDLDAPDFTALDDSIGDALGEVTNDKPEIVLDEPEKKPEPVKEEEGKEPAKAEEPAKEEGKEEKAEPSVDEEIEKYQPPANASKETRVNFKEIKALWKADKTLARELQGKVAALEEQIKNAAPPVDAEGNPVLPEPIKERLTALERLEQSVLLEKSPVFAERYVKPVEQAETALFEFLKTHGLPDAAAEEIRAAGVNNWDGWGALVQKFRDPLNGQEVLRLRSELRQKDSARQSALEELKGGSSKLPEEIKAEEEAERQNWGKAAAQGIAEAAKELDWLKKQEIPEGATEEQKKAIEAHNATFEKSAADARARIVACYQRDPKITSETVVKSLQAERLQAENAKLQEDLKAAQQRAEELEERVGAKQRAGRISRVDTAGRSEGAGQKLPVTNSGGPDLDESADEAFDRHFGRR